MTNLRRGIRYFVRGMSYGSITYLMIIAFFWQNSSISTANIITVFVISGLIGAIFFKRFDHSSSWNFYPIHGNDAYQSVVT